MPFRVLSLDGGGAWALIEVRTLITLYGEHARGHEVLANFDLVAANSGGSLVLAGLVEDLPLTEILQYFNDENERRSIFSPTNNVGDEALEAVLHFGPKYSASAKLPAIERLLPNTGENPFEDSMKKVIGPAGSPVHLLIVGFDYDRNRAVFFRSAPAGRAGWGDGQPADITLAGAVHSSTNAPINYFDAPATLPGFDGQYWDGGITGCNNPAVVAVIEAIVLGHSPQDIRVLALGTGTVSLPLAPVGTPASPLEMPRPSSSLLADLKKLAGAMLDDPPDAATFIAHAITGGNAGLQAPLQSRVVRMSPLISPFPNKKAGWIPPKGWSVARFLHLCNIDMDAVVQSEVAFINDYCTSWLNDLAPKSANPSLRQNI